MKLIKILNSYILLFIYTQTISLHEIVALSTINEENVDTSNKINIFFIDNTYRPFLGNLEICSHNLVLSPPLNFYNLNTDFIFTSLHLIEYLIRRYKLMEVTLTALIVKES